MMARLLRKSDEDRPKSAGVFPITAPLRGEVAKRKPVTIKIGLGVKFFPDYTGKIPRTRYGNTCRTGDAAGIST